MATITFSARVPEGTGAVHFVFPTVDFDLDVGGSYETDDPNAIANASVHPWLVVEVDPESVVAPAPPDLNDPHQTPSADHLSAAASPEAVEAAQKAQDAQTEANKPQDVQAAPAPVEFEPAPAPVVAGPVETPYTEEND